MRLEKVTAIPPRQTREGTTKGKYNEVTRMLRDFQNASAEIVEVKWAKEEYTSSACVFNNLYDAIKRNRMRIKVLRRGDRVFLTHLQK